MRSLPRLLYPAVLLAGLAALSPTEPAGAEPFRLGCQGLSLTEVAREVGLDFLHQRGGTGEKHLPETMGSGVAWLDFDGDGWMDLYVVQSGPFPARSSPEASNRLFRNRGDGTFEDWTERSGTGGRSYGQGVVAGDVDGDGLTDLYVTNFGLDRLYLNRGDGTFRDATEDAGLRVDGWSSAAALGDGDRDGDLDLYVTRYVEYDPEAELFCGDLDAGIRAYCDPSLFDGAPDLFFRNRGDGTFEEATEQAGLAGARGRGLGVLFTDLDDDGDADLYVSNDLTLNLLFENRGDGTFEDLSLLSGTAVNGDGKPEAGMGLAVGDVDGDGTPDLAVTNFDVETNTLYRNLGYLQFDDVSAASGFGPPSFNLLGFGLVFADLDLDGDLDAWAANGHIFEDPLRDNVAYAQPDLLLLGDGRGRFASQACGVLASGPAVSRGLGAGDYDNDGDVDLAVSNSDGPLALLRNELVGEAFLGVILEGAGRNPEAVGAKVKLRAGGTDGGQRVQTRWVLAGDSYQSTSDRRLLFGWGEAAGKESTPSRSQPRLTLEVTWPSGKVRRLNGLPAGDYLVIRAEAGEITPTP